MTQGEFLSTIEPECSLQCLQRCEKLILLYIYSFIKNKYLWNTVHHYQVTYQSRDKTIFHINRKSLFVVILHLTLHYYSWIGRELNTSLYFRPWGRFSLFFCCKMYKASYSWFCSCGSKQKYQISIGDMHLTFPCHHGKFHSGKGNILYREATNFVTRITKLIRIGGQE